MHALKLIIISDEFKGAIGAAAAVVLPWIKSSLPLLQWAGALGGLVLLFYSIRHKRLEYKKLKSTK